MKFQFLNKRKQKQKKKSRISLKSKWTIGTALAIFFTYTIFSFAIFLGFRKVMISQEDESLREILNGVSERLNTETEVLTERAVYEALSPSYTPSSFESEEDLEQRNLVDGQSSNYDDDLFAMMNQNGVSVRVYSPDAQLLFESESSEIVFEPESALTAGIIEFDGREVLYGTIPVYSDGNQELIGYADVVNELVNYNAVRRQILIVIILIGGIALVFSGIVGSLLAANFLRPIKQITNTMNDIRNDTQSTSRIMVVEGKDELTHLSNVFNDMLDKMQKYIEQQKQFVEDVSHELRTPVAVMEGHLKLLNRWGKEDPEILNESLSASLQEIERMKSLVQEMLDLSRAEQVEIHYKNEKTAIKPLVKQTINNFRMIYPDFVFILDDAIRNEIYLSIYRNHLEQILTILLDNAVKYSTTRKEIHVSIATEKADVHIAIQDFGEGMTQEDTEKVFNRFYRIDKARSRHKGGNGLGLSIAKELLFGYKGTISVESVLDHGSIFRIKLPIYNEQVKSPS